MFIKECCEEVMHKIDDGSNANGFYKTGERSMIGKDISFYTCETCSCQWRRTQETFSPCESVWAEDR
ncbi:hypothetical protein CER19_02460 [Pseudomonas sp. GL93]|nr:hypothetical protein CER19_02460 [Pseudomonas sp. GL93]